MTVELSIPSRPGPGQTESKILIGRTRSGEGTIDMTEGIGLPEGPEGEPNWAKELGDASGALTFGARNGVLRVTFSGFAVSPDEFLRNFEDVAAAPLIELYHEGGLNPQGVA